MARNKTKRKYGRKIKGGNQCSGVSKEPLISGGGKKRKYKSRKKRRNLSKRRKSLKSRRRMKGGAFHGYDALSLAGIESAAIPITTQVVKARPYRLSGAPLDQPINNKYGDHNPPLV